MQQDALLRGHMFNIENGGPHHRQCLSRIPLTGIHSSCISIRGLRNHKCQSFFGGIETRNPLSQATVIILFMDAFHHKLHQSFKFLLLNVSLILLKRKPLEAQEANKVSNCECNPVWAFLMCLRLFEGIMLLYLLGTHKGQEGVLATGTPGPILSGQNPIMSAQCIVEKQAL